MISDSTLVAFEKCISAVFKSEWDNYTNLSAEYVQLPIEDISSCVHILSPNNVEAVSKIVSDDYNLNGFVFDFTINSMKQGWYPPIIEYTQGRNIILDGAHRLYSAKLQGIKDVHVIRLNSDNPLPPCASLYRLDELEVRYVEVRDHKTIFTNFDLSYFRPLRKMFPLITNLIKEEY